ncbi:citrate synthase-lysine N-methyltransferase CSKMT, mitochondrial-like isoform X1 [Branchiostoma lanceolatum]|uniref:citrate synthase-lysine N-methyltransferase CSKMT, mitochondrial-like isoform X1 n=1 Tax=Branchiostoma lanceolatum TaxID=7740 RepID=UPI003456AC71
MNSPVGEMLVCTGRLLHVARVLTCRAQMKRYLSSASGSSNDDLANAMGKRATWENFYKTQSEQGTKQFDWFVGYEEVVDLVSPYLHKPGKSHRSHLVALDLGCGLSNVALKMCLSSEEPMRIVCADIVMTALETMRQQYQSTRGAVRNSESQLLFTMADASQLPFRDRCFDVVLDKGTTDVVIRSSGGSDLAKTVVQESLRVLRCGGHLLQFSDEDPDIRLTLLNDVAIRDRATVTFKDISTPHGMEYFMYVVQKGSERTD